MYDRTAFLRIVMFGLMVSVATIALPAASFQTQATLWSVFDGVTKVCEQSNNPVFTESTAPETGNPPWTWSVTNIRGFAGSADFSFVRMNADGTQAALHWTAIETSDWRTSGGCEGLFDLTLTNGVDADVTYPDFQVSLRYLALSGYTVFKGQTGGGRGIPASDPHTYTFNVIGFGGTMPGDLSMTMNNVGAVTEVSGTIAGTEDDTMDVRILDGSRPYSDLTGIPLSLRLFGLNGYTVFKGQTGGGRGIPASDPHTYTFNVIGFGGTMPGDLSMTMNNVGAVTEVSGTIAGTEDDTMDVRILDGSRPYSDLTGIPLSLRLFGLNGYTVFKGQTGGGRGIPASDPHTYTFNVIGFGGTMPGDLSITMNNVGAVTEVSGTIAGTEDDTMDVRILDGSRPYSDLTGIPLSLRRIVPEILTVPNNGGAGSINLEVGGDAGPWDWFDYEDGLDNSVLTGPDSFGSSSLTVSWAAGALETDETGAGAVTIQRSYGSSPPSTVALETVITEAAPMPVSCWPILAASLAIVAVVLMMSRKYSTVA